MYKKVESKIENAIFEARIDDNGEIISYRISPSMGYKLHEKSLDTEIANEETLEKTGEIKKGYTKVYTTAGVNYDFEVNDREIYAIEDNN